MEENDWFFGVFEPQFETVVTSWHTGKHKFFWRVRGTNAATRFWLAEHVATGPVSGFTKRLPTARRRANRALKRVNKRWRKYA